MLANEIQVNSKALNDAHVSPLLALYSPKKYTNLTNVLLPSLACIVWHRKCILLLPSAFLKDVDRARLVTEHIETKLEQRENSIVVVTNKTGKLHVSAIGNGLLTIFEEIFSQFINLIMVKSKLLSHHPPAYYSSTKPNAGVHNHMPHPQCSYVGNLHTGADTIWWAYVQQIKPGTRNRNAYTGCPNCSMSVFVSIFNFKVTCPRFNRNIIHNNEYLHDSQYKIIH